MTAPLSTRRRFARWRASLQPRDRLALGADALMVGWGVITATGGLLATGLAFIAFGLAFAAFIVRRVAKRSGPGLR